MADYDDDVPMDAEGGAPAPGGAPPGEGGEYEPEVEADGPEEEAPEWAAPVIDFDEFEIDENTEKDVFTRFVDMLKGGSRTLLLPLQCAKLVAKDVLPLPCREDVWGRLPNGDKYDGWREWMRKYTVGQLARIAGRMLTTATYTVDAGVHATRYNGFGTYSADGSGVWMNSEKEFPYVIPVSKELHGTAMAVGACVKLTNNTTYVANDRGEPIATTQYEYVNMSASGAHPLALKQALRGFIAFPPGEKCTAATMMKRPFYWEAMASKVSKLPVLTPDMSPLNAFYYHVNASFAPMKGVVNIDRFLPIDLVFKDYAHIIHKSWFLGGLYIRGESFMIKAQEDFFPNLAWSGMVTDTLPNWARKRGMRFQRDAAKLGDPNLSQKVTGVIDKAKFTGIVWNPMGDSLLYENALGVAMPVGSDWAMMKPAVKWLAPKATYSLLVAGTRPFILTILASHASTEFTKIASVTTPKSYEQLFKKAACIGYYNFVVNLTRAMDPTCTRRPYAYVAIEPTPEGNKYKFGDIEHLTALPLGRYMGNAKSEKIASALDAFASYFHEAEAEAAAAAAKRKASPGDAPETKRKRPTDA